MAYMCQGCSTESESWPGECPQCHSKLYLNIAAPKADLIGTVINGRYKVVSKLGQGGMGTVYKAMREEMGQTLAIKVLNPEFSHEPEVAKRFLREAKSYGTIQHPNAVNLLDFGQTPEGALFIAMEYIAGQDLGRTIVERGRLPIEDAIDVCVQCADVLGYAHEKGIIHRDMKPENVMLTRGLRSYHAKVLDFGIARLMSDNATQLTIQGTICGTPRYMSPEQARGKEIDNRSDIYSLGLVLFEMLSGRQAYTHSSITDLLRAQVTEPVPHLWEAPRGKDLPEGLDVVIQRACNKDRDQRFISMGQFADALSKALPTQHELKPFNESIVQDPSLGGRTFLGPGAPNALVAPPMPSVPAHAVEPSAPAISADVIAKSVTPAPMRDLPAPSVVAQPAAAKVKSPQDKSLLLADERPAARQAASSRGWLIVGAAVIAAAGVGAVIAWPKLHPAPVPAAPVATAPVAPVAAPVASQPVAKPAPVAVVTNAPTPTPPTDAHPAVAAPTPTPGPTHAPTTRPHRDDSEVAAARALMEAQSMGSLRDADRDFADGRVDAVLLDLKQVNPKSAVASEAGKLQVRALAAQKYLQQGERASRAGNCPVAISAYKKALALSSGFRDAQAAIERCRRAAVPDQMESP